LSKNLKWLIGSRVWKLVFTALLLCGSLAHNSEASPTIQCDHQTRTTSTKRGFGVNCAAAQSDLESDTLAEANSTCQSLGQDYFSCPFSFSTEVVVTKACEWNENHSAYKVVGFRNFQCAYAIEQ
jgi:hypothetical protein